MYLVLYLVPSFRKLMRQNFEPFANCSSGLTVKIYQFCGYTNVNKSSNKYKTCTE